MQRLQSRASGTGFPVHEAVGRDDADALSRLLRDGADPNERDAFGRTPLHMAVSPDCRPDCLRVLLEAGADLDLEVLGGQSEDDGGVCGGTPLHAAAESCRCHGAPCLRALLDAGADAWVTDSAGDNPLHRACLAENAAAVAALLAAEPRLVNCPTVGDSQSALTCLHVAAAAGNYSMLRLLLRCGADHLVSDGCGRSAVDILLNNGDTDGIDCLGRRLISGLRSDLRLNLTDLLAGEAGRKYLADLLCIDCAATETPFRPGNRVRIGRLTQLEAAAAERGISAQRLVDALVDAFQLGLTDDLDAEDTAGLMGRLAGRVGRLVLLPQDAVQLRRLTACRRLWLALAARLQLRSLHLFAAALRYRRAMSGGVGGPCELLLRALSDCGGRWRVDAGRLNDFVASLTEFWRFKGRELMFSKDRQGALRDPLQSLTTWAVLTGRTKLVPILLRQEEFDFIPLALLSATLLRALSHKQEVDDILVEAASRAADLCEVMAVRTLKAVKDVDSSVGNSLTIAYVSQPLPNYAGYTVLDLAARGCISSFIKLDIAELATDRRWFGDFFLFHRPVLRELLIAAGFLPPLMLFLPRLLRRYRDPEPRRFLDSVLGDDPDDDRSLLADGQEEEQPGPRQEAQEKPAPVEDAGWLARFSVFSSDLRRFYSTPCVKFRASAVFYFTFVTLLSLMILHDFQGRISVIEVACYVLLVGLFVEELREMAACRKLETLSSYLTDGWNILDLVAVACGCMAFVARRTGSDRTNLLSALMPDHERQSRSTSYLLIVVATLIFWMRVLFVLVVLEPVGVKLKMLSLVVKRDFIPFLYIAAVVMAGFGIAFQALLWPDGFFISQGHSVKIPKAEMLLSMFRRTFYAIVGEYGLDELENECNPHAGNATDNATLPDKCVSFPGNMLVQYGLLVLYIVVMQILLMNVIVAMFSKTVDAVDAESRSMWLIDRYDLNQEYARRSALPIPLNLLLEMTNLVVWLAGKLSRRRPPPLEDSGDKGLRNSVYLFYLFYQAVTLRRLRPRLDASDDADELTGEAAALSGRLSELGAAQADMLQGLEEQNRELGVLTRQLDYWLTTGRGGTLGVTRIANMHIG